MTFRNIVPRAVLLTLLSILIFFNLVSVKAQQVINDHERVAFCLHFLHHLEWTKPTDHADFVLGVVSENKTLTANFMKLNRHKLQGKTLSVKVFHDTDKIRAKDFDAVFVGKAFAGKVPYLAKKLKGSQTLLISNECPNTEATMINLVATGDKLKVVVNERNLRTESFATDIPVIYNEDKPLDISDLYVTAHDELEKERSLVDYQSSELRKQRIKATLQDNALKKQAEDLKRLKETLQEQKKALMAQDLVLKEKEKKIQEQRTHLDVQLTDLEKGKEEIALQQAKISSQEANLYHQHKELGFQKNITIFSIILIIVLAVTGYLIYLGFSKQKKAKAKLQASQDEVIAQNEELRQQQEEILSINDTLAVQKESLSKQHTAITQSIQYAQNIQTAILPSGLQIKKHFRDHFLIYKPKDIVSGDFYFTARKDNKKLLVVADCTGHGVPGAFMSLLGTNILNDIINSNRIIDPAMILTHLQRKIKMRLKQNNNENTDGMDLGICQLEESVEGYKWLFYAGSKNKMYHAKKETGEVHVIESDRIQIGGLQERASSKFENRDVVISDGDMIYMASDGFQDQSNEKRRSFSAKRLQKLLKTCHHESTATQKEILEKALAEHQGNSEQRDDITMIGFRI